MVATTLPDAFNALDPHRPVSREQVAELFVVRAGSPVHEVTTELVISHRPIKVLFVGHRGSGKTS